MMKNILNIALVLVLTLPITIFAQDRPFEEKGAELLSKASEKIQGFQTLEAEVAYEMENTSMDVFESMSGKLYAKGDKYRLIIGDNIFISDGETVWNFIDDLYEVHINYVEDADGGFTPTAILDNFETEFRSKFIRQETHKSKTVDIIDLIPNTPQAFFKYRVAIDASSHMIVYTIAFDRHGGSYTYSLNNVRSNRPISDSKFVFDPADFPEGVDIIDLR